MNRKSNYTELMESDFDQFLDLVKTFDSATGETETELKALFQDFAILSANDGAAAYALARHSRKWCNSPAAQNIEVLKLRRGEILRALAVGNHDWGNTSAAQNIEVLTLFDGLAVYILASSRFGADRDAVDSWGNSPAAQNLEVLQLSLPRPALPLRPIAEVLAENNPLWRKSPAAFNPEVFKLGNTAIFLSKYHHWGTSDAAYQLLNMQVNDQWEVLKNLLTVNKDILTTEQFATEFSAQLSAKKVSNSWIENYLVGTVWQNTPQAFSRDILELIGFESLAFEESEKFVAVDSLSYSNPLIKPLMSKCDGSATMNLCMRAAVSGSADLLPDEFISTVPLLTLQRCVNALTNADKSFDALRTSEVQLLASIAKTLFLERFSQMFPMMSHLAEHSAAETEALLGRFTIEELTFVSDIECGAIANVIKKHALNMVLQDALSADGLKAHAAPTLDIY